MRVLLIGHACSPVRGSEPGNTWNLARGLADAGADVWLVSFPEFVDEVDAYLAKRPTPNLRIHYVDTPSWDPWKRSRSPRFVRLHYVMWLRAAEGEVGALHDKIGFDVVHHISWTTVSVPPTLWRLGVPFVWGPVGGGQSTPAAFMCAFGPERLAESWRSWSIRALPRMPRLRQTVHRAALVLSTNRETTGLLERAGAKHVRPMLDSAIEVEALADRPRHRWVDPEHFVVLSAGRLEPRKGVALALHAVAELRDERVRLRVAGQGPQRKQLEALAHSLGIASRVSFLGMVPWHRMVEEFSAADAFIFPSIRDSFGSVVLEAMAHGLPVVALDHQGVGSLVPDGAALKARVVEPRSTIAHLAEHLRTLVSDDELRGRMSAAAWHFAQAQDWSERVRTHLQIYEEVIADHSTSTRLR